MGCHWMGQRIQGSPLPIIDSESATLFAQPIAGVPIMPATQVAGPTDVQLGYVLEKSGPGYIKVRQGCRGNIRVRVKYGGSLRALYHRITGGQTTIVQRPLYGPPISGSGAAALPVTVGEAMPLYKEGYEA